MPVRVIEELQSRRHEKIAAFLTLEQLIGLLVGFFPLFLISSQWPLILRVPVCLAAAIAGYVITVEIAGLPLYERAIWALRGLVRLRLHGDRLSPDDLPGAIPDPNRAMMVTLSGPITPIQRQVHANHPPEAAHADH